MLISVQDPPGHVRPFAREHSLRYYWNRLMVAGTLVVLWETLMILRLHDDYVAGSLGFNVALLKSAFWMVFGGATMFVMFQRMAMNVPENEPILLSREILRLARTPIGWALLREGAELAWQRQGIECVACNLDGLTDEFKHAMIGGTDQAAVHAALDDIVRKEADLLARQRRLLAGETVDKYDVSLACPP